MTQVTRFEDMLAATPLVAILRGVGGDEAIKVCEALLEAGILIAEIPLNSPDPMTTIARLAAHFEGRMAIGAGTVTDQAAVAQVAEAGATFCVAPNVDMAVIAAAHARGLAMLPGCATPSEAFAGLGAGAQHLKYFPAAGRAGDIAALRAVLPRDVKLIAVGGVDPGSIAALRRAGVDAFGIGSELYRPGRPLSDIADRARLFVAAIRRADPSVTEVAAAAAAIGESPVVLPGGTVLWVNPVAPALLRLTGEAVAQTPLTEPVFSLGLTPTGDVAAVLADGFGLLDPKLGRVRKGPVIALDPGCRLNDTAVDSTGGLWAGAMHRGVLAARGSIYHAASSEDAPVRVADGLGVPNGMAFTPAGDTLLVIDTLARTLLAYPADQSAGTLGQPVIVSDFMGVPGKPDGMTLDADGNPWVAMWGGGCIVKLDASGAVADRIDLPAPNVSSLCVTGDRLYVSTSRARLSAEQLARWPGSGSLFAVDLRGPR